MLFDPRLIIDLLVIEQSIVCES